MTYPSRSSIKGVAALLLAVAVLAMMAASPQAKAEGKLKASMVPKCAVVPINIAMAAENPVPIGDRVAINGGDTYPMDTASDMHYAVLRWSDQDISTAINAAKNPGFAFDSTSGMRFAGITKGTIPSFIDTAVAIPVAARSGTLGIYQHYKIRYGTFSHTATAVQETDLIATHTT